MVYKMALLAFDNNHVRRTAYVVRVPADIFLRPHVHRHIWNQTKQLLPRTLTPILLAGFQRLTWLVPLLS